MNETALARRTTFAEAIGALKNPRVITMLFLGFSAGVPILLIFSSLSLWLREAGVSRSAVTFFSWAALGYSFKFVWAPLIDRLPVPLLGRWLGRRRSWMLVAQIAVIAAIMWMASTDPSQGEASLKYMAMAAVALGFSSATQDIVIDAYRIEAADDRLQAMMSSSYIAGYRIGMLVAGAGALFIADALGSSSDSYSYSAWYWTYMAMAAVMIIGVVTTLVVPEPERGAGIGSSSYGPVDYLRFLLLFALAVLAFIAVFYYSTNIAASASASLHEMLGNQTLAGFFVEAVRLTTAVAAALLAGWLLAKVGLVDESMLRETYVDPVRDFFRRYGAGLALLLLALIGCYRISDIVLGVISNVFYQDMGYTKTEIAAAVKTYGLLMTIFGGFLGGVLAMRFGVMKVLFLGALLSAATNLLFMLLATSEATALLLYVVISADNLAAGIASAAFVAFLSSLTSISFTAVQYAIFSSLMTLLPKILGGYSGSIVEGVGYPTFFVLTTVLGIPALILVVIAGRKLMR